MKRNSKRITSVILAVLLVVSTLITSSFVTASAAAGDTIYCETTKGTPNCYMWTEGVANSSNGSWPGVPMTKVEDNIYSFTLDKEYNKVIFNLNGDADKTKDMEYPGDNQKYNFDTGEWSLYDTSAAVPAINVSKENGSSFRTETMDVVVSVSYADKAEYKISTAENAGTWTAFENTVTLAIGEGVPVNHEIRLSVRAANSNGTDSLSYVYTKKDPNAAGGSDGSTAAALGGHYSTNGNGYGKNKTITVDGDPSDWDSSMIIAQGVANDDPRVYCHWSMHEVAVDSYALYAAWDDNNLYLMWEMANVQDAVANDDFPMSQGNLWIYNYPTFLVLSTDNSIEGNGTHANGKTVWDTGTTWDAHIDRMIAFSTNGANGPYVYIADEDGKFPTEGVKDLSITQKWGQGILSSTIYGIKEVSSQQGRVGGDTLDETQNWVDLNLVGHKSSKYDMTYEMAIPFSSIGISKSDIESMGIGAMLVSTYGTSGMNTLPMDPSMWDNAAKEYSGDPSSSHEKEDSDHITVPLARIGKALPGGSDTPAPTTPLVTAPPEEAGDMPTTPSTTDPVATEPQTTEPSETEPTTEPSEPTNPTEPTEPTEPTAPTNPTVPTEPTVPTNPTEPSVPTNPTEPTAPTETAPTETEPTTEPQGNVMLGDVDGNGKVNIKDATQIQRAAAFIITLDETQSKAADVNGDGKSNVNDVTAIQRFVANIETGYKIGELI